jgi:GNAT superfamily N-acetyltransferase
MRIRPLQAAQYTEGTPVADTKIEDFTLRFAVGDDIPLILEFIRGLAAYENMLDEVEATEEILRETIFGRKTAEVLIGEYRGEPACFALFFHNISTFTGRPGIYLEDLFVKEGFRGRGFGRKLLARVAQLAVERGCGRVEWACLDWNEPSIGFYKSLGARPMGDWTVYRLQRETFSKLAQEF